jgi:magnesium-protoporphyrin O-methyltransferase
MTRPQCCGIEQMFDAETAQNDRKDYRKNGPSDSTRMLIAQVREAGVQGRTVLDIGGGVGAIQHALLESGASQAVQVDASSAYLAAAREEADARGLREKIDFLHGDFVDLAPTLAEADIVTLDKVLCCYDDMQALVRASADLARETYALVFPHDNWLYRGAARVIFFLMNIFSKNPFRGFVHPTAEVEAILTAAGLTRRFYKRSGLVWQVVVYQRQPELINP